MERLNLRLENLNKVLFRLEESLKIFKEKEKDDLLYALIRDSVIQRFEMTVDIFWKSLKDYLENKFKITISSPRGVFKECFSLKVIDLKEYEVLEDMIDDRNNTTHDYDESMAEEIVTKAYDYYKLMFLISRRLK